MNVVATSQNARTAINDASRDYNGKTHLAISNITTYSAWAAENIDYGATQWEGQATWYCQNGIIENAQTRLNNHYLSGRPVAQLKVVWLHEMGHSVGLDHVTDRNRMMWKSASEAYSNGVRTIAADEVTMLNYLY